MTLWRGNHSLILASQSKARQRLLAAAGLAFDVLPASIDERAVERRSGLSSPGEVADRLAREKALSVSGQHPGRYVVGADQTLAQGARRFSKPGDRAAAAEQLRALAGRTHALHSAVALARNGEVLFAAVAVARMTMRPLAASAIDAYLDEAGPVALSSVGCYQLEGLGVHLFERIEGDHFTILGLPLLPLLGFMRQQGLIGF